MTYNDINEFFMPDGVSPTLSYVTEKEGTITDCNRLAATTSKTSGYLTYKELSRGGTCNLPADYTWRPFCYGGGKFVAMTFSGNKGAYSYDGINWVATTLPASLGWESVCYNKNGLFLGVPGWSDNAAYSYDGITWYRANYLPLSTRWVSTCYNEKDTFVTVGEGPYSGEGINKAVYSYDGITWYATTLPYAGIWRSVKYGNGKFVTISNESNKAAYSYDGINWYPSTLPTTTNWHALAYGKGKFVAIAWGSKGAAYSTNGINWLGSNCKLSFNQKSKISITTTGSGTLTFKSGVSGTTQYSVSGTKTTELDASRLTGNELNYFLSNGVYTTKVVLDKVPARLYSITGNNAIWAVKNSSGTPTTQSVTFSSSNKDSIGYYKDLSVSYTLVRAATGTSKTEAVYDMIDFTNSSAPTTAKNGKLSTTFSGTMTGGLYTVASASGARITTAVRGTIELTIAPKMDVTSGSITTKYGSNTNARTVSEKMTITVTPSDMQKSGTSYYMDFDATNVVLLNAKLVKWEPEFTKLTVPSWSSYVDFSQPGDSKHVHASTSLLICGRDTAGTLGEISYDSNVGYWCATGVWNLFVDMQPYSKNDGYLLVENFSTPNKNFEVWYGVDGTRVLRWNSYLSGLTRLYFDAKQMNPSNGFTSQGGKHAFIVGGVTQPINAALYNYVCGAGNTNLNSYITPNNDFNRATLKKLTTAACNKLKSDYGDSVRVYVVKYRKQDKWSAITRTEASTAHGSTPTAHSYTEIDNCASTTGGTAYDVTTEADLKAKLNAIAEDIKDWAEYEEAKNIAPE